MCSAFLREIGEFAVTIFQMPSIALMFPLFLLPLPAGETFSFWGNYLDIFLLRKSPRALSLRFAWGTLRPISITCRNIENISTCFRIAITKYPCYNVVRTTRKPLPAGTDNGREQNQRFARRITRKGIISPQKRLVNFRWRKDLAPWLFLMQLCSPPGSEQAVDANVEEAVVDTVPGDVGRFLIGPPAERIMP